MPKIIDNLSKKLIRKAYRQVMKSGYAALNIRSVAKAAVLAWVRSTTTDDFTAPFVSESMLVWSVAVTPLARISSIIHKNS